MLSIKISIVIMVPAVSFSFAMISDNPSLRLPFPNFPSTAFRSPISFRSVLRSSAWSFPGLPSFGPDKCMPSFLQSARFSLPRYILSARILAG